MKKISSSLKKFSIMIFTCTFILTGISGMQCNKAYAYSTGATFAVYTTTSNVNVRKGPGESYGSYGTLSKYTAIESGQIQGTSGSWTKVRIWNSSGETVGYISSSFLNKNTTNRFYTATSNVKVRKGPGTSYSSITTVTESADQSLFYKYKVSADGYNWVADLDCDMNSQIGSSGYYVCAKGWTVFDYYK